MMETTMDTSTTTRRRCMITNKTGARSRTPTRRRRPLTGVSRQQQQSNSERGRSGGYTMQEQLYKGFQKPDSQHRSKSSTVVCYTNVQNKHKPLILNQEIIAPTWSMLKPPTPTSSSPWSTPVARSSLVKSHASASNLQDQGTFGKDGQTTKL